MNMLEELNALMLEKGVIIRAIPNCSISVYEPSHFREYPDGRIQYCDTTNRGMLYVERSNGILANKFLVAQSSGKGNLIRFNTDNVFDSLQDVLKYIKECL